MKFRSKSFSQFCNRSMVRQTSSACLSNVKLPTLLIFETHQTLDTTSSNPWRAERHSRRQEGTLWWSHERQVGSPRDPLEAVPNVTSLNIGAKFWKRAMVKGDTRHGAVYYASHEQCLGLQWLLNSCRLFSIWQLSLLMVRVLKEVSVLPLFAQPSHPTGSTCNYEVWQKYITVPEEI